MPRADRTGKEKYLLSARGAFYLRSSAGCKSKSEIPQLFRKIRGINF